MLLNCKKSIIPACDVETLEEYRKLVNETKDIPGISSYKLGFELALRFGLPKLVEITRVDCACDKPLIYDHQKAATDIPDTGVKFARTLKSSGIDIAILFPQAGPVTQEAWIAACREEGLGVMVGGLMTHKGYAKSDGGYLSDEGIEQIYINAAKAGISDFIVPGTKPAEIQRIRELIEQQGLTHPNFYSPGYAAQGGSIAPALSAAAGRLHPIIGRGLYGANNIREAALKFCEELGAS